MRSDNSMDRPVLTEDIIIPAGDAALRGILSIPQKARGIVLFAHGSGSSRLSPRNSYVARTLQDAGLATLLMDLLTEAEDADPERRFDIGLLKGRLLVGAAWLSQDPRTKALPLGIFGASTGAAAALDVAVALGKGVRAVVSRGGRPDLTTEDLAGVTAPALFIVGGDDPTVLAMNRAVYEQLTAARKLVVIPGATHLFEEPGTLEQVAKEAAAWFLRHFKT